VTLAQTTIYPESHPDGAPSTQGNDCIIGIFPAAAECALAFA